ncbi:GNAT family N-acetyltransferase [Microbacterium luticocti]|uniref:GNAT family N-acetyltransferase n=1 Tax=Microbacterium luticocti TaxID=451764 RepID=UPI0004040BB4|nr:GNAT family N-acetyltransferase [Microbacterium luticocti]
MTITVRPAQVTDARAISTIRISSWRVAYAGLIPAAVLDRLDVEAEAQRRALQWEKYHTDPRVADFVAEVDGAPAGWASSGPCRDDDGPDRGELYALYALPEHWSTGVGHALMVAVEHALRAAGYRTASLWVLDGNERAAAFYQRHGWREDGTAKDDDRIVGRTGVAPLHERRRVRDLAEPLTAG